ncbi:MAG: ABC transporter substrate-binding protein [Dehalococcoidia bacterium]|nr:ABC transporter substrate-binding protein [Dehalococcoidia bacterium]
MCRRLRMPRVLWAGLVSAALLLSSCAPAAVPAPAPAPAAPRAPAAPASTAAPAAPAPTAALVVRPTATPQPTATATPVGAQIKKGGTLNVALWSQASDVNLLAATSMISLQLWGLVYDGLVKEDPLRPGVVAPDLAEKWDISGDGTKITFALRKGVTFHNGKPLTSADVKASVARWMKDSDQLEPTLSAVVKSVEAPDANTLVLNLKFPYPDLFRTFMMDWASVVPADAPSGREMTQIYGSGAYKWKNFQSGVSFETVKNDKYWNKSLPHLDGVTVFILPDRNTGLAAFRAGRIDITAPVYLTVPQFKTVDSQMKGQATAYLYANSFWWNVYIPSNKKPWSDPRVRRAVFMAIDRKQAVATVDQGLGTVDGVLPPGLGGLTPDELKNVPGWREPKSRDIDEAKKLLAEAGFPNGLKTDIFYRTGGDYLSMATFVKDQLANIGVTATLTTRDGAAFYDYVYARSYELHAHRHPLAPASPDTILNQYYRTAGPRNFADVADPKLDALIDKQMFTLDQTERKKQVKVIDKYLYDNAEASIISWGNYSQAWQKWVRDFIPGETIYNNIRYETVWLDK